MDRPLVDDRFPLIADLSLPFHRDRLVERQLSAVKHRHKRFGVAHLDRRRLARRCGERLRPTRKTKCRGVTRKVRRPVECQTARHVNLRMITLKQ